MKIILLITCIALLSGCVPFIDNNGPRRKWYYLSDTKPPPIPSDKKFRTFAVVRPVPTVTEQIVVEFDHSEIPHVLTSIYYSSNKYGEYQFLGNTTNNSVSNIIERPIDAEYIYLRGKVLRLSDGQESDMSYIYRDPNFEPNAIEIDSIVRSDKQIILWQSPNMKHWVGYYTKLPETNMMNMDAMFYTAEVALTVKPLWLLNEDHFGK